MTIARLDMILCERCEGRGFNLWMDQRRPKFLRCPVCGGERTIMWLYGAAPCPPLAPDIRMGQSR